MIRILPYSPALGPVHPSREKSELDAELTRKFLKSTKLELEMRVADKSDPLWLKRIRNEWPIARVKRIMKRPTILGSPPRMISADAVYLMAYATRVFLRLITARAARFMIAEKRTTLLVRDIIAAVKGSSHCDFLLDIVDDWEESHKSMQPTSKRGLKANEAKAALSNQGLKAAPSAQGLETASSTLLPRPPTGSRAEHQERDAHRSQSPLPMPGTGWETPQVGSFDLGAELRQWGSESADLLSDRFNPQGSERDADIAFDWEAAQLALDSDSFEFDGELAHCLGACA
jgi:histone H3/H4